MPAPDLENVGRHVVPMTPLQQRVCEDGRWARTNAELEEQYRGQVVAVGNKQVVAHGPDLDELLTRLQRAGLSVDEVAIVPYPDPFSDIPK